MDLTPYYPRHFEAEIDGAYYIIDNFNAETGALDYFVNRIEIPNATLDIIDDALRERFEEEALNTANLETARLDRARERALSILRGEEEKEDGEAIDVIEFILDTVETLHIGDRDTAEGLLIAEANQSIVNSRGMQPAINAESQKGKTQLATSLMHVMPVGVWLKGSLSDQALFYMDSGQLCAGMTIFSDDATLSEMMESLIKQATSDFQGTTTRRVASRVNGKWSTRELLIPPRIKWVLTSVDSKGSEQFVNRQISFGVDESDVQDQRVAEFELAKAEEGRLDYPITEDVLTCREIFRAIKVDDHGAARRFDVKIPFAKLIEWGDKKNRRNISMFIDMIKGYAVMRFMQRGTVEGQLIATIEDYASAARLYNTRSGFQKLHVTDREKEMLQHIAQNGGELDTTELMAKMNLSRARVRKLAERLENVLPLFHIDKRTETTADPSDTGKHTARPINYYCYDGDINLLTFESVVSLRNEPNEQTGEIKDHLHHLHVTYTSLSHAKGVSGRGSEKAKNDEIETNKDHNNNNNININDKSPLTPQNGGEYTRTRTRVSLLSEGVSGHETPRSETDKDPNRKENSFKSFDEKVQVLCKRGASSVSAPTIRQEDFDRFVLDSLSRIEEEHDVDTLVLTLLGDFYAKYDITTEDKGTIDVFKQLLSRSVNDNKRVMVSWLSVTGGRPFMYRIIGNRRER